MKEVSRETVITFHYDSEFEMKSHRSQMVRDGWMPCGKSFLQPTFSQKYSKVIPDGVFI